MGSMRRRGLLLLFAGLLGGCVSAPASPPTLSDYTHGASAFVGPILRLYSSDEREPGGDGIWAALEPIARRGRDWRAVASPSFRAEAEIVGFPPEPTEHAALRVRVVAEGESREPGERARADDLWEFELVRSGRGPWKVSSVRAVRVEPIRLARPHLREVSSEAGLGGVIHEIREPAEKTNISMPATHHHAGVLLLDADADGDLDLMPPGERPRLFLNDGRGRFREGSAEAGLDRLPEAQGAGGCAADLDGDGAPEVFLSNHLAPARLLMNDGHGRFRDVTVEAGLAGVSGPFTSAVFFDADRDGRLDLFVACYGDARFGGPAWSGDNGPGSRFFRNVASTAKGIPVFVDETGVAGLRDGGWSFAVSACDFDLDGDDDLYVANDFGTNRLWENVSTPGRPAFRDIAPRAGVDDEGFGMGVAWGDVDGDGRFDLHVSNFWSSHVWLVRSPLLPMPPLFLSWLARGRVVDALTRRSRGNSLFRNRGDGTFERISDEAGVADGGWSWGCELVDLDGDGRDDLAVAEGMFEAAPGGRNDEVGFWNAMVRGGADFSDGAWGTVDFGRDGMASGSPERLFLNRGDGRFEERAWLEGFDARSSGRGLAVGDLDGDLAPELVLGSFRGALLVYRNGWNDAKRVSIRLVGAEPGNRDAVGAVVRLESGGRVQLREVRAGSSYLSQSALELAFGLGGEERTGSVEVRWPDGRVERRSGLAAGSRVVWREGEEP